MTGMCASVAAPTRSRQEKRAISGVKCGQRIGTAVPYIHAVLPEYAELHCLSNFSFLRGASHPEELVERAHGLGYAALAITDECSVAGVVRAHLAAKQLGLPL